MAEESPRRSTSTVAPSCPAAGSATTGSTAAAIERVDAHHHNTRSGFLDPPDFLFVLEDVEYDTSWDVSHESLRMMIERLSAAVRLDLLADPSRSIVESVLEVAETDGALEWRWADSCKPRSSRERLPPPQQVVQRIVARALDYQLHQESLLQILPPAPTAFVIAMVLRDIDDWMWRAVVSEEFCNVPPAWSWLSACLRRCSIVRDLTGRTLEFCSKDSRAALRVQLPWLAARNLRAFTETARRNPALLPLLVAYALPGDGPVSEAQVRSDLYRRGLNRSHWRRLARWPHDPLLTALMDAGLFSNVWLPELVRVLRNVVHVDALTGEEKDSVFAYASQLLPLLAILDPACARLVRSQTKRLAAAFKRGSSRPRSGADADVGNER